MRIGLGLLDDFAPLALPPGEESEGKFDLMFAQLDDDLKRDPPALPPDVKEGEFDF